jgi:antitoxin CptB
MQIQANNDSYRRLAWQCRRGMRELDELLLGFLSRGYAGLDADGQAAFDALLAYPDAILLELLMGRMTPADKDAAGIVREIRNTAAV